MEKIRNFVLVDEKEKYGRMQLLVMNRDFWISRSERERRRAFWSFCVRMNQLAVPPH
jgi:hypothetical protein